MPTLFASPLNMTHECIGCSGNHIEYGTYSVWPNQQAKGWFCYECGPTKIVKIKIIRAAR